MTYTCVCYIIQQIKNLFKRIQHEFETEMLFTDWANEEKSCFFFFSRDKTCNCTWHLFPLIVQRIIRKLFTFLKIRQRYMFNNLLNSLWHLSNDLRFTAWGIWCFLIQNNSLGQEIKEIIVFPIIIAWVKKSKNISVHLSSREQPWSWCWAKNSSILGVAWDGAWLRRYRSPCDLDRSELLLMLLLWRG